MNSTSVGCGIIVCIVLIISYPILQGEAAPVSIHDPKGKTIELYKESYALLIGSSEYVNGWPDLPGVEKDIQAVEQALLRQGFTITKVMNPNSNKLRRAFEDFIRKNGRNETNRLLFYFAGHGYTMKQAYGGDMGYIVPTDSPLPDQNRNGFLDTALDMQMVEVYAKRIQSRHALFVFDSCFSGSVFDIKRSPPPSITHKISQPVRQLITSGSADEEVPDKSIFCLEFVEGIKGEADLNQDGYVTGTELGEHLTDKVINYSRDTQHPQYGKIRDRNLDKGDFVFVARGLVVEPIPPEPGEPETQKLTVETMPREGRVYVNGSYKGEAPVNLKGIEPGEYTITVKKSGCVDWEEKVKIRSGDRKKVTAVLDKEVTKGSIEVTSTPKGAKIYLNGFYENKTDCTISGVEAGRHRIEITKEGYKDWEEEATVTAGETAHVTARLKKKMEAQTYSLEPKMAFVKGGWFEMGCGHWTSDCNDDEKPAHRIQVSDFYLGKYEVTKSEFRVFINDTGYQTQWEKEGAMLELRANGSSIFQKNSGFYWDNPGFAQEDDHPVVGVSWNDAEEYCQWLTQKTGKNYRLPSEVEWEYAARGGGKKIKYPWGNGEPDGSQGNFNDIKAAFQWKDIHDVDGYENTAPVGSYPPNELGLYDMAGNVAEWCQGEYDKEYYAKTDGVHNPVNTESVHYRVVRGSSFGTPRLIGWNVPRHRFKEFRTTYRSGATPLSRNIRLGFRVALPVGELD